MKTEVKPKTLAQELRETGTGLGERAAAAMERKDRALRELLEMVYSEASDFDHALAHEECMGAAKHQANLALRAGQEGGA
jgi:alpha-D-ribose 1-methylphosphonate 5-triphosphate synthase subunit PhnI